MWATNCTHEKLFRVFAKLAVGLLTAFFVTLWLVNGCAQAAGVRADVAPPESPPGSNPMPGQESTQVRMAAEQVVLEVQPTQRGEWLAQAALTADFQMLNLGAVEERLEVRFPLAWNDGFFRYPEIRDFQVWVDNRPAAVRRVELPEIGYRSGELIPWAVFDVTFPPDEPVQIRVRYTADGSGEYPFAAFKYVLETGAGWKGTIGTADFIVRLPYEANAYNVILGEYATGFSTTTPGAAIDGNELRWHFEDLEPAAGDNFEISLVMPDVWRKALLEQDRVQANPQDGEAWGRLGKIYKEMIRLRRGLRQDSGGQELYQKSVAAYEQAVTLKPDDALWHFGFADLLWSHYFWHVYWEAGRDLAELERALQHLERTLALDPGNERALTLLAEIQGQIPEAVQLDGQTATFLLLTATPQITLPWDAPLEATILPSATAPASATAPPTETKPSATLTPAPSVTSPLAPPAQTETPAAIAAEESNAPPAEAGSAQRGSGLCGSALGLLPAALWIFKRRRP